MRARMMGRPHSRAMTMPPVFLRSGGLRAVDGEPVDHAPVRAHVLDYLAERALAAPRAARGRAAAEDDMAAELEHARDRLAGLAQASRAHAPDRASAERSWIARIWSPSARHVIHGHWMTISR